MLVDGMSLYVEHQRGIDLEVFWTMLMMSPLWIPSLMILQSISEYRGVGTWVTVSRVLPTNSPPPSYSCSTPPQYPHSGGHDHNVGLCVGSKCDLLQEREPVLVRGRRL